MHEYNRAAEAEHTLCARTRRALTELQHDVKEAREAIEEVVDDDQALAAVCLSEGSSGHARSGAGGNNGLQRGTGGSSSAMPAASWHTPGMRAAAALLSSYERQVQSVEGALKVPCLFSPTHTAPPEGPCHAGGMHALPPCAFLAPCIERRAPCMRAGAGGEPGRFQVPAATAYEPLAC